MVKVKQAGRNGKLHWLPGPMAYTALCGAVDAKGDWMPIREDVNFWGECKRCKAIKAKAEAAQAVS